MKESRKEFLKPVLIAISCVESNASFSKSYCFGGESK